MKFHLFTSTVHRNELEIVTSLYDIEMNYLTVYIYNIKNCAQHTRTKTCGVAFTDISKTKWIDDYKKRYSYIICISFS